MEKIYCKLRANITIEGDIDLAERELCYFFREVNPISDLSELPADLEIPNTYIISNTRKSSPIAFVCSSPKHPLKQLAIQLSFIQEIWISGSRASDHNLSNFPWCIEITQNKHKVTFIVPFMASAEILSYCNEIPDKNSVRALTLELSGNKQKNRGSIRRAINKSNTSTPHVHGLHKYKAKFFPRMIRSLIICALDSLPINENKPLLILDPFVGSGTALAEAALLNLPSKGIDIDKLSCRISQAKIEILSSISLSRLQKVTAEFETALNLLLINAKKKLHEYKFPDWIAKKFERLNTLDEQESYEQEISGILDAISQVESKDIRNVLEICLSDALSRKFNIRMMGTGVGRFALEISKTSILSIFQANLRNTIRMLGVCQAVLDAYSVKLAKSEVICDSATNMPISDNSVSMIITSPPYLPASSGRENYLIGKSISITALGLMTPEEINKTEKLCVGSMKVNGTLDWTDLPAKVHNLYNWLYTDELRNIKAHPTYMYYRMLKEALLESYRVLMKGGLAIYVIGKESVFYKFSTRDVLYRVECDKIFQELAVGCGFQIEEQVNVQLDKKNLNARPRSLDSYFESVFLLRKPVNVSNITDSKGCMPKLQDLAGNQITT